MPAITTRQPDGRLRVVLREPIAVASSDPADLQRATQAIADAVADTIRPAPEQWYSFKPIWPATEAEAADLERRGARDAGRAAGSGPARESAAGRGRPGRGGPGRGHAMTIRGRLMLAASWLACRLPERPALRVRRIGRRAVVPADARAGRAGPAQPAAGHAERSRSPGAGVPPCGPRPPTREALERLVRSAYRHAARYYVEVARNPSVTPAFVDERLALDTPELIAEAVVPGQGRPLRRAPFRLGRDGGHLPGVPGRRDGDADGDHRRCRGSRRTSSARAAWPGSAWSACARPAASSPTRSATASRSASSGTAT